jgi:hypothetical protein
LEAWLCFPGAHLEMILEMIMNRLSKLVLFVVIVSTLVPAVAQADYYAGTMDLLAIPGYFSGGRGEFTLRDSSNGFLGTSAYADVTTNVSGSSFQSFCVELNVQVANPVDVWVSTTFIDETTGAETGPGSHAILGGKTYGDNLEEATAYLYTRFAKGILSGYDYDPLGQRAADAGELQEAIWSLEEGSAADGKAAIWIAEANAAILAQSWSGIGGVRILNMYEPSDNPDGSQTVLRQDQLYLPDAGGRLAGAAFPGFARSVPICSPRGVIVGNASWRATLLINTTKRRSAPVLLRFFYWVRWGARHRVVIRTSGSVVAKIKPLPLAWLWQAGW